MVRLGERYYREGLLSSGKPGKAVAVGDVAFQATQFSCVSCHRRSGMGSSEGDIYAPMVTKAALYSFKRAGRSRRPAYTDETLARALRLGVDPTGRQMNPLMPRYDISDRDMECLIAYLKQLSATASPGVTAEEIHFATVVTDGVDPEPMLSLLRRYVRDKNNELRNPRGRRRSGAFYRRHVDLAYRKWRLHRWTLTGSADTWKEQLEAYYREQPVFALLSGMSSGGWQPVHDFCEENEIPCLLPNTDLPVISEDDYHTIYFSGGLFLEASVIARDLSRLALNGPVVQVYRGDGTAVEVAGKLRRAAGETGSGVIDVELASGQEVGGELLEQRLDDAGAGALVLWLDRHEIESLAPWLSTARPDLRIYLSSTRLGGDLADLPESPLRRCVLVHPFCLVEDFEARFARVEVWLWQKGIPPGDRRIMAQTYFACMLAGEALMHVRFDYFYRDYFLETIDHLATSRLAAFCASHPAPSFGPGQRYLSKGCYVLAGGGSGTVEWIVP